MNIDDVKPIIEDSTSYREVLRRLGYAENNSSQRHNLVELIKTHNIDTSHFSKSAKGRFSKRWTDKVAIEAAAKSASGMSEFLKTLGLSNRGSNFKTAKNHLIRFGIDFSHFSCGGHGESHKTLEIPLKHILEGSVPTYQTHKLKLRLISAGIKENKCEREGCGLSTWHNSELICHLDHIDGDSSNHKLENLRMLCPNCHSQTSTYAGRKNAIRDQKAGRV